MADILQHQRDPAESARLDGSPFATYILAIRARERRAAVVREERRAEALSEARRVAAMLRERFGATEVFAFGSIVDTGPFDDRSDIDLAASGIAVAEYFRAWADAAALASRELDLIDLDTCSQRLRAEALRAGLAL